LNSDANCQNKRALRELAGKFCVKKEIAKMNFPIDPETMSLAELEAEYQSLVREKGNLAINLQARENELQQAQNSRHQMRETVQHLIEKIVNVLLPDLSPQTLTQLRRIFPNEPNLFARPENELPEQLSFAQRITQFWRRFILNSENPPEPLEQRRVLLRGLLWRLSDVPAQSRSYRDPFHPLMQKKQELSLQEKAVNTTEAQANRIQERLNAVSASLSACKKILERRKNVRFRDEDSLHHQSPFDTSFSSPIILSDFTNFDSSSRDSTSSASSDNDFSFGGGGDAAGGGVGGSWENYS
jgi:DNA repair exonuclease SbcCD ATPase subunit